MIGQIDILEYAQGRQTITVRQIVEDLKAIGANFSHNTIISSLNRMVSRGLIQKTERGIYNLTTKGKRQFVAYYDNEMHELDKLLAKEFPFLEYCIWNSEDIRHYSHYVVNMDILFVDVEKDGMEAVFSSLLNHVELKRLVFKSPSEDDYANYITGKSCIVIRQLISQAPLVSFGDGSKRTSIEKIMVDVAVDSDFRSYQGYETLRFYRNILDQNDINERRLLRYAERRSCKEKIAMDIAEVKQNKIFD